MLVAPSSIYVILLRKKTRTNQNHVTDFCIVIVENRVNVPADTVSGNRGVGRVSHWFHRGRYRSILLVAFRRIKRCNNNNGVPDFFLTRQNWPAIRKTFTLRGLLIRWMRYAISIYNNKAVFYTSKRFNIENDVQNASNDGFSTETNS